MRTPAVLLAILSLAAVWPGCIQYGSPGGGAALFIDDETFDVSRLHVKEARDPTQYVELQAPFEAVRFPGPVLRDTNSGNASELFFLQGARIQRLQGDGPQYQVRANPRLSFRIHMEDFDGEVALARLELRSDGDDVRTFLVVAAVGNGIVRDLDVEAVVDGNDVAGAGGITIESRTGSSTTTMCYAYTTHPQDSGTTHPQSSGTTQPQSSGTTNPQSSGTVRPSGQPPCNSVSPSPPIHQDCYNEAEGFYDCDRKGTSQSPTPTTSTYPPCYNNHDGYHHCNTSTPTPSPSPSPTPECGAHRWGDCSECPWTDGCPIPAFDNRSDVQFRINSTYRYQSDMRVDVENVGNVSYTYNTAFAACYLQYYTETGRRFLIPPGTHCDIWMTDTLEPGERVTLFTWRLKECTDDQWGCAAERFLGPGTYHIRGNFTSPAGRTSASGASFQIEGAHVVAD